MIWACSALEEGTPPEEPSPALQQPGPSSSGGSGNAPGATPPVDPVAGAPDGGGGSPSSATPDAGSGVRPVSPLPAQWIRGSAQCNANVDPPLQVHRYDDDTWVLRQNKCINFEGPFLFLLMGQTRALLLDSGATADAARFPVATTVRSLINMRLAERGQASIELVVAHSHAHGDHVAGDRQFAGQAATTVVGTNANAVSTFFGFAAAADGIATYELGGRALRVLSIPGHDAAHLAIHDPRTGWLLTGDTLYPGRLYIRDWAAYRTSIARLTAFAAAREVTAVLGTHIEMTSTAGVDYPVGTTFQPNEPPLTLSTAHLRELNDALTRIGATPRREVHDLFIITPL
jgi:hydroxyacylglutathione hydrolase